MLRSAAALTALLLLALGLSGYPEGPTLRAGDRTGSPLNGTPQRCGTCHRGGDFDPVLTVSALDDAGEQRGSYVPGETYTLRFANAATGSPAAYGFQAVALDEGLAAVGDYGELPDDFQLAELDGRPYFEHARRQPAPVVEVAWTAPPAGTGPVTVYAASTAVNGADGSANDDAAEDVLVLAEARASGTAEAALAGTRVRPLRGGRLRVELPEGEPLHELTYAFHDPTGRRLASGAFDARAVEVQLPRGGGLAYLTVLRAGTPAWTGAVTR